MKLSKLYSNQPFQNLTFNIENGGLNAIVADAKNLQDGSNQHCVGKTKLGELLDFMLIKKHTHSFLYRDGANKETFKDYEFYLELLLNSGTFLTIKRSIENPTKISFIEKNTCSEGYKLYISFDETLTFEKAQEYLNKKLNLDFCNQTGESYRRIVNYSLRTQGDYNPKRNTIFQLDKFQQGGDKNWKPLLFSLLGFDGEVIKKKYQLEEDIKETEKQIKIQEKKFDVKFEDRDLVVGKIQNTITEKEEIEKQINALNFYEQDKQAIEHLVGNIEKEIAELNQDLYVIEHEIEQLTNAIRNEFAFDLKKVKSIFEEVSVYFPNELSKSYEDLIDFNKKITVERNKQIRETIDEKKKKRKLINEQLINLNQSKNNYADLIQDTSLFKKYTTYQRKIVELEKNLSRYQIQLEEIDKAEIIKKQNEEKEKVELQDVKNQLSEMISHTSENQLYTNIRKTFSQIVKHILNEDAIIGISLNNAHNIEFKAEFPSSRKDEGATYYKILCVAFDLAVLISYRDKSHFRFVYHDDVISGDDNGVKMRLINSVKQLCQKHNIQYIFSAIKDNIPANVDIQNQVILELNNNSDEGKLFKKSF